MSEALYYIRSDIELPLLMQGEIPYDKAYDMVCYWNDTHVVEQMAWLERSDDATRI